MIKKIAFTLVTAIILLGLLGIVSGYEFDNVKNYDSKTREVTVENAFGIGEDIAKIKLESELEVFVIRGEDRKVAEFTLSNYDKEYPNAVSKIDFYNLKKGNKKISREFTYKYKVVETVSKPVYGQSCSNSLAGNGSLVKNCVNVATDSKDVKVETWIPFSSLEELPNGDITIGIFTDVLPGERVEWIPTFFGVEIDEWAIWTEALNENIVSFYKLNETSGDAIDAVIGKNGSLIEPVGYPMGRGFKGIINNSYNFSANIAGLLGTGAYINFSNGNKDSSCYDLNCSVSFWINFTQSGNRWIFQQGQQRANGNNTFAYSDSGVLVFGTFNNTGGQVVATTSPLTYNSGHWIHVVGVLNKSDALIYVNGTLLNRTNLGGSTNIPFGLNSQIIGGRTGLTGGAVEDLMQGGLDEIGIWNRSLTASEVSDLYNNGLGITYTTDFLLPSVSLGYPADNFHTINSTQLFNSTGTGSLALPLVNATLYVWNPGGSVFGTVSEVRTGITNTSNLQITGLSNGNYTWNFYWCVSNSQCEFASPNRTLIRDSFTVNGFNYAPTIVESTNQVIGVNISYDSSYYSSISANLVYNNTILSATPTGSGDNLIFNRNLVAPIVNVDQNVSFYWNFILNNGGTTVTNTSVINQSVVNLNLDNCGVFTNNLLNFTLHDEDTRESLNGTVEIIVNIFNTNRNTVIQSFNNSYSLTTGQNARVCINSLALNANYDYQAKYYSNVSTYEVEYKFSQNNTLNSGTQRQDVKLYDLLSSRSTSFTLILQANDLSTIEGAVIDVQRAYIPIDQFLSVESPLTDTDGTTVAHLVAGEIYYNFIVTKNGQVLGTFNNYLVQCQNAVTGECRIFLNLAQSTTSLPDFENYGDIAVNYLWSPSTRQLTMSFLSTDGDSHLVAWNVTKLDNYGNNTICTNSATGTAGSFLCTVPTSFGNTSILAQVYSDGVFVGQNIFSLQPNSQDIWGGTKVVLGIIMYGMIALLMIGHPVTIIIGAILGMGAAMAFHLVDGGTLIGNSSIFLWFVIAGGIIIFYMRNKS